MSATSAEELIETPIIIESLRTDNNILSSLDYSCEVSVLIGSIILITLLKSSWLTISLYPLTTLLLMFFLFICVIYWYFY
jgi:Na+-transporting NADH:ubiquinone oxidoreductase subunit NqrB